MYVLLVCVWCSLDAGGFLMVVTAQPTVYAEILTPEADRKEGGQVDMRCTAKNLESIHVVQWATEDPDLTLRWGQYTVSNANGGGRFTFDTSKDMATQTVVQDFTITNVQRADTDEYVCSVNEPTRGRRLDIVASSNVTLSVLYFPSQSFPMCSPAGPITVDAGTELDMRCSSESSHGTVTMTIKPTTQTTRCTTWTPVINVDIDEVGRTLDLTVDDADNGVAFECVIASMYFTGMHRTCQIGPITVRNTVTEHTPLEQITTAPQSMTSENNGITSNMTCLCSSDPAPSSTPWVLAFIVSMVLTITFSVIVVIFIFLDGRKNRLIKSLRSVKEPRVTEPDPYMELQPTEDQNRVYMEPTTAAQTITTQNTYYQPVEVHNGSPEHDYARPNDSTDTNYEVPVRVPHSAAEKQYQNMNN